MAFPFRFQAARVASTITRPSILFPHSMIRQPFFPIVQSPNISYPLHAASASFSTSRSNSATYNQVRRGCRVAQRARKTRSPALVDRPEMKGVCLKTGITKPKKPNSGERKIARIRLSSGRVVTGYIPGEGSFTF